jgi:hypothetical protein
MEVVTIVSGILYECSQPDCKEHHGKHHHTISALDGAERLLPLVSRGAFDL